MTIPFALPLYVAAPRVPDPSPTSPDSQCQEGYDVEYECERKYTAPPKLLRRWCKEDPS